LVFVAVLKQLALIALIILAPVACLAFVFREQGKNLFAFWAKALTAVVALPVVLSAVLAGGIMLMKIFWNPSAGSIGSSDSLDGSQPMSRFIATIILAATLFAMLKVLGSLRKWVTGSRAGMIGKIGSAATQIATPAAALAAGAYGGPAAMAAVSAVGGKISSSAGGAGGSGSKFLPDSSAGTFKAASAAAGGGGGASQIGKLTSGLSEKLAKPGQDRADLAKQQEARKKSNERMDDPQLREQNIQRQVNKMEDTNEAKRRMANSSSAPDEPLGPSGDGPAPSSGGPGPAPSGPVSGPAPSGPVPGPAGPAPGGASADTATPAPRPRGGLSPGGAPAATATSAAAVSKTAARAAGASASADQVAQGQAALDRAAKAAGPVKAQAPIAKAASKAASAIKNPPVK